MGFIFKVSWFENIGCDFEFEHDVFTLIKMNLV